MNEPTFHPFVGGQALAFTHRCPEKETPNEDSVAIIPFDEESGLLVVADGVGGNRAGDRASAMAVATLKAAVQYSTNRDSLRALVLDGIERSNEAILNLAIGAASTLCVMEVRGREIRPYHVGDSMMLVVGQRGKIKWQSIPHSPVGYAVE
jgi:serine/threonine protein phosphatase PrpC